MGDISVVGCFGVLFGVFGGWVWGGFGLLVGCVGVGCVSGSQLWEWILVGWNFGVWGLCRVDIIWLLGIVNCFYLLFVVCGVM